MIYFTNLTLQNGSLARNISCKFWLWKWSHLALKILQLTFITLIHNRFTTLALYDILIWKKRLDSSDVRKLIRVLSWHIVIHWSQKRTLLLEKVFSQTENNCVIICRHSLKPVSLKSGFCIMFVHSCLLTKRVAMVTATMRNMWNSSLLWWVLFLLEYKIFMPYFYKNPDHWIIPYLTTCQELFFLALFFYLYLFTCWSLRTFVMLEGRFISKMLLTHGAN